jgi:lipooligosaccharide transport system ATP-binding protein
VIEVQEPVEELRAIVRAHGWDHEDLEHRLLVYSDEGEKVFQTIDGEYCKGGCALRMATLEDVFLKLTGRDLRE